MKTVKVRLGKGCQVFYDPSQGITLCVGEVVEVKLTKKVKDYIDAGNLIEVQETTEPATDKKAKAEK